ncbi:MAG TPA: tail fiber domain-containing protein [Allosphingosinicella sp.]|nr:tail fiber domain-containing protein [Allosphingosinicella sp.]
MINFVDAGGQPDTPSAAAANLALIHSLIANTSVANPGGHDHWGAGPHIYFPPGHYHFSGPIRIRKAVRLEGSSAGTRANYNTIFSFPQNSQGLVLDSFDTDNLSYLSYENRLSTGTGTRIEGIYFRGSNNGLNTAHGVLIRAFVVMRDVHVTGFGGHGIYLKADLSVNHGGQASNSQFYDCGAVGNNGSGLVIEGGDANIIQVVGGDYSFNGDWGVADLSFLGCTFTGIHASQNGQPNTGYRGTNQVSLVTYPGGSGQVWAIRANYSANGLTTQPGTNELVWTRYHGQLSWTPPTWTSNNSGNLAIRPGGPYLTASSVAWSVWTGCYSEGNQGPSQMSHRAIVIGGDHGSGIQSIDTLGTGQPIWLDTHNGELDLKSNLRVKGLLLGQKRARPQDSVGMKMSAASSAPVSGALYSVSPYMEYGWSPGDIVWNQDRSVAQTGVIPPLGWRCTDGPDSFEEIPFPTSSSIGANPTFTSVTASQFIIPYAGTLSMYGGEMEVRASRFRVLDSLGGTTALLGDSTQFPQIGTTASAANAYLDAGAGNRLLRSTSSLRYKTDVTELDGKYLDKLLDLRPVRYRSAAEADDPSLSHFGLVAEEVAEIEPRLVNFTFADEDYEEAIVEADSGEGVPRSERKLRAGAERKVPDGVQYDRLAVLLLGLVKRQQSQIDALEARVGLSASPGRGKRS